MNPVAVLMDEHRKIEAVLECLDRIVAQAHCQGLVDQPKAEAALDFFQHYADGVHHAKEEDQFFPLLELRGLPNANGPTEVMRREHEMGRACIRALREALPLAAHGDPDSFDRFAQCAAEYTALLRAHIRKEDHCLFPLSIQLLSQGELEHLASAFSRLDNATDRKSHFEDLADFLMRELGSSTTSGAVCAHSK
ncbi:MAG: hypothetical protein AMXMBFR84_46520 [Candidatus Hydrogenedentota bacterium]